MKKYFVLILIFSFQAFSQTHNGAISTATAGAGRAAVEPTDSPFLNPAALAFIRGYYFTSSYSGSTQKSNVDAQDFSLSLTDNLADTVMPTSLTYVQRNTSLSKSESIQTREFGLAFGGLTFSKVSLGLSGRQKHDTNLLQVYQQNNLTFGTEFAPNERVGFALVTDNFVTAPPEIPESLKLVRTSSIAFNYNYKAFVRSKIDLTSASNNNFAKPTLAGGVETYMNRWLILRVGIARNAEKEASLYAAGVGFTGPKFGVHYGYLFSPEDQSLSRHSVDLAVPVW